MANDTKEDFWGCTLSKDQKEFTWDPREDSEDDVEHKLQLSTACLGHKAKDGERNLVEVTTEDDDGENMTCPVVALRVGGTECLHLDLGFHNKTKFTLVEGNGPLALCGVHLQALPLDYEEDEDESSGDEDIPDLVLDEKEKPPTKPAKIEEIVEEKPVEKKADKKEAKKDQKRPAPQVDKKEEKPAKKKKQEEPEPEEDEEDDEEDDEEEEGDSDEEMEDSLLDNEAEEGDEDEESEEDEEPEEGDEVDTDEEEEEEGDSEEEEEEEDESEEEEAPPAKKKMTNGHAATPANDKKQKQQPQSNKKTPAKKEQAKKPENTPKSTAKKTPEEIKAFLLKSPNLPKKFDKFANFMKNNMKVTDNKAQKELWDYVQKNKK